MAYNTGNAVGSTDARDLYDNAVNLDTAVNSMSARWTDRLGISRPSWSGMVQYADIGPYAAGIEITGYNEIFLHEGEYYRASASTTLPYTTTGSWSDDGVYFVSVGDAVLRQELETIADTVIGPYRNAVNCNQYGGLQLALSDSDTLGKVIIVTDDQSITDDVTVINRAIACEFSTGIITIASNKTLTINGPFSCGLYQCFSGGGSVIFGTDTAVVHAAWIGKGDGATDRTAGLQMLLNGMVDGQHFMLDAGVYIASALAFSKNNCVITGPGTLKKKANVDGVLLSISGIGNIVDSLVFDGSAAQPSSNYLNDILVVSGNNNKITQCQINSSAGGGITIANASDNTVAYNNISNVHGNAILVANLGADRNKILFNNINGTVVQNGIFITASSNSTATTAYVYDNEVIGNTVRNAGDTSIESGIHTVRTRVSNNSVDVKANPGILFRDAVDGIVEANNITVLSTAITDALAVVAQTESTAWSSRIKISNNSITGYIIRSGVYINQSDVETSNNSVTQTAVTPLGDGSNLPGAGIIFAGVRGYKSVSDHIKDVGKGIDLNYPSVASAVENVHISGADITNVQQGINLYQVALRNASINSVKVKGITQAAIKSTGATAPDKDVFIQNLSINPVGFSLVGTGISDAIPGAVIQQNALVGIPVPVAQYGLYQLVPSNYLVGTLSLQIPQTSSYAIVDIFPGGYSVRQHSADIAVDLTGFANWGIGFDGNNNLILQRRGATISSVGNMIVLR